MRFSTKVLSLLERKRKKPPQKKKKIQVIIIFCSDNTLNSWTKVIQKHLFSHQFIDLALYGESKKPERRRLYDVCNVMVAMDLITKGKKPGIYWRTELFEKINDIAPESKPEQKTGNEDICSFVQIQSRGAPLMVNVEEKEVKIVFEEKPTIWGLNSENKKIDL